MIFCFVNLGNAGQYSLMKCTPLENCENYVAVKHTLVIGLKYNDMIFSRQCLDSF